MRIMFASSDPIAVMSLKILVEHQLLTQAIEVRYVLTSPDKPRGRGLQSTPSDISMMTMIIEKEHGGLNPAIVQYKPAELDDAFYEILSADLRDRPADLLVTFSYGKIFPQRFLDLFPMGGINVHPSLLPKYRGATPIPQTILEGDLETGVSIIRMTDKLDAGHVLGKMRIPVAHDDTTESLSDTFGKEGAALLLNVITQMYLKKTIETPQDDTKATYCTKIKKEDGLIDWHKSARDIDKLVRAFNPWPRCYTSLRGARLIIHEGLPRPKIKEDAAPGTILSVEHKEGIAVQTGEGVYLITRLQLSAKKAHLWNAFLRGTPLERGEMLG